MLFVLVSVYHAFSVHVLEYLIPLFLLTIPFILQGRVNFRFSIKDTALSLSVSLLILLPFGYLMSRSGNAFSLLPAGSILFQLIGISLPEEVYFRGFLQERLGNTIGGIVIASLLFSIMHIPQVIMYGDIYSILTFFPSIVMGYLYMKTSSILPSTIFHFSSNIVWLGFITA